MEVSASRRRGVPTPIIACRGLRSEERRYRIAMAGEKCGPTSMTFSGIPVGYDGFGSGAAVPATSDDSPLLLS